jgi:hypothetical protein
VPQSAGMAGSAASPPRTRRRLRVRPSVCSASACCRSPRRIFIHAPLRGGRRRPKLVRRTNWLLVISLRWDLERYARDPFPLRIILRSPVTTIYFIAASTMAMSCSVVPPLTPTPAMTWPSLMSGTPPPIAEYLPPETARSG